MMYDTNMSQQYGRNDVIVCGTALEAPVCSHEDHNLRFYRFPLCVPRLSGLSDRLPVLLPESLLPCVEMDRELQITGHMRSFNNRTGVGRRLVLTVYATGIVPSDGTARNQILLWGTICRPPVFRRTPLGRSICDIMLAVPRKYQRTDYLPVIAWGRLAALLSTRNPGDLLCAEGRIQSRLYTKQTESGPQERTAYEVSLMRLLEEDPDSHAAGAGA